MHGVKKLFSPLELAEAVFYLVLKGCRDRLTVVHTLKIIILFLEPSTKANKLATAAKVPLHDFVE